MLDGAAAVMLNGLETAPVKFVPAVVNVYPFPILSIERLLKVAVPARAATVVVPVSVPDDGLVPTPIVTAAVELTRLFDASSI